jgi:hypothetical protein
MAVQYTRACYLGSVLASTYYILDTSNVNVLWPFLSVSTAGILMLEN